MKNKIFRNRNIRNLIAVAIAVVAVALGMRCITPDETIRVGNVPNVPHISIVRHNAPNEQSISAGFFLPTERNVNCRVSMPKLLCDVDAEDIGGVNVFAVGDKAHIISAIDANPDIEEYNVLVEIHTAPWQKWKNISLGVTDGAFFEDISTAARYDAKQPVEFGGEGSVLCIKSGDAIFSSPSELAETIRQSECFPGDAAHGEKLLAMKNFRRTPPVDD